MSNHTTRPLAIGMTVLGGLARSSQNLNFAPVGAISLFAGARLRGWQAYALPIVLMLVTDPFLGGYSFATPFVYASFLINVWIGSRLRQTENPVPDRRRRLVRQHAVLRAFNFGTWLAPHGYPHTMGGLAACFAAALPFFRHTRDRRPVLYCRAVRRARAVEPHCRRAPSAWPATASVKTLLAWSSGKDSAWTLHMLRQSGVRVDALLTTINEAADRVAMHGVRRTLLAAQAEALEVPLWDVPLPWPCTNDDYECRMAEACRRAVADGFDTIAFGDLYLRDVRAYREKQLAGLGPDAHLSAHGSIPTALLARDMIAGGLRARLSCVDSKQIDRVVRGTRVRPCAARGLPPGADPCGENGEFHTFVYDGPMFRAPIAIESGEIRDVGGFVYADLKEI